MKINNNDFSILMVTGSVLLLLFGLASKVSFILANPSVLSLAMLLAMFVDVSVPCFSIYLVSRGHRKTALVLVAATFVSFAVYHTTNFGNSCNCFDLHTQSNFFMLFGTLCVGCSLFSAISMTEIGIGRKVFSLIVFGGGCFLVLNSSAVPTTDFWVSPCSYRGQEAPFLRDINDGELMEGRWTVFFARTDCDSCKNIARSMGNSVIEKLDTLSAEEPMDVVIIRKSNETGDAKLFRLSDSANREHHSLRIFPSLLEVSDGVVGECTEPR